MLFVLWLVLPQFRGAHYIFTNVIHPQGQQLRQSMYKQFGDQSHLFKGESGSIADIQLWNDDFDCVAYDVLEMLMTPMQWPTETVYPRDASSVVV